MRKLLILLAAAVMFTACDDDHDDDVTRRLIRDFTVYGGDWHEAYGAGGHEFHYFYKFNFAALDNFLYNNGTLVAYYKEVDGGTKYQHALPYLRPRQNLADPTDTWTEIANYEYSTGSITFKVYNDDFNYSNMPVDPGTMTFRVVILW